MRKKDIPRLADHRDCLTLTASIRAHPAFPDAGREIRYRKGAYIWRPEDAADRVYVLQQGQVVELRGSSAANRIITRIVAPGEPFGHFCFCVPKGGIRGASAQAGTDTVVLEVRFDAIMLMLQSDQKILSAMLFDFCSRVTEMERRLEILTYRGAGERVGHLLLDLGESLRAPMDDEDDIVQLQITHDQLARMTAMSRAHVTVTMVSFRKAGLVRYSRAQPLVVNLSLLRRHLER